MRAVLVVATLMAANLCSAEQASSASQCHPLGESKIRECVSNGEVRTGTLTKEDLTVEGFSVGRSTLDQVAARFPGAPRYRLAKGEESPVGICVKNRQGYGIEFSSGWEGGWATLDTIVIAPSKDLEESGAACLLATSLPITLSTESGIGVGKTVDELRRLVPAVGVKNPAFEVEFETSPDQVSWAEPQINQSGLQATDGWVASSGISGQLRDGKIRRFTIYAYITN